MDELGGRTFPPASRIRHGTESGYVFHQRLDQEPCAACFDAKSRADKRRLAANSEKVLENRMRARAQGKALSRLKDLYPGEYKVLYQIALVEQRERAESEQS